MFVLPLIFVLIFKYVIIKLDTYIKHICINSYISNNV
jgi:hypothetical protein